MMSTAIKRGVTKSQRADQRTVDFLAIALYNAGAAADNRPKPWAWGQLRADAKAFYRKLARRAIQFSTLDTLLEATCAVCHCTDSKACMPPCSWIVVNRLTGQGVCSRCTGLV
jgi:hypothetical protein